MIKLNLIAAASENMGIGKNNDLPWRLKTEMDYFRRMTTTTNDSERKNVVIMGRRTWDSIPKHSKPFPDRINFVLSRSDIKFDGYSNVMGFKSLEAAIQKLQEEEFKKKYEKVWVIGGSNIYKESMESEHFYRLYLTRIKKVFDCDTFMPTLRNDLVEVVDPDVPTGIQKEKNLEFEYKVYESPKETV